MSDNLTIFGADYTNVTGIKAKGTGNGTLTYIRPDGTKSITANGTGIDVTQYASVDVAVNASSQDSTFVVTVSWNSSANRWEPDCTWAEVNAAAQAGKEIVACGPMDELVAADCDWVSADGSLYYIVYWTDSAKWQAYVYELTQNGIFQAWDDSIRFPSGTVNITASGNTNVSGYQTASVPVADHEMEVQSEYLTQSNQRKWRFRPVYVGVSAGWMDVSTVNGSYITYNAVAANTTITPSTSSQTIGGANYMMEGAVTVAAMPSGTAGTPTATKGTVSNHSISVTPSVTNTTGYITGGTKTGTAVTVSASELVSGTKTITGAGTTDVTQYASASVAAGSMGTPVITKGTPSRGEVSISASVTNTAGYISGGTLETDVVHVDASELVDGTTTITENGTYDVTYWESADVAIPIVTYSVNSAAPTSSQGSNGDIWLVTQ